MIAWVGPKIISGGFEGLSSCSKYQFQSVFVSGILRGNPFAPNCLTGPLFFGQKFCALDIWLINTYMKLNPSGWQFADKFCVARTHIFQQTHQNKLMTWNFSGCPPPFTCLSVSRQAKGDESIPGKLWKTPAMVRCSLERAAAERRARVRKRIMSDIHNPEEFSLNAQAESSLLCFSHPFCWSLGWSSGVCPQTQTQ